MIEPPCSSVMFTGKSKQASSPDWDWSVPVPTIDQFTRTWFVGLLLTGLGDRLPPPGPALVAPAATVGLALVGALVGEAAGVGCGEGEGDADADAEGSATAVVCTACAVAKAAAGEAGDAAAARLAVVEPGFASAYECPATAATAVTTAAAPTR